MCNWVIKQSLCHYKNQIIVLLTPLVLLPLPLLVNSQIMYMSSTTKIDEVNYTSYYKEAVCGYVMLLMGTYWCTMALPIAITSLLPVFLMPMMGLMTSDETCAQYYKDNALLFVGGLMVAVSIKKSKFHRRVALTILLLLGTKPAWLMLGFMLVTWFLSMWISNTATASIMLPIMEAVLSKLESIGKDDVTEECLGETVPTQIIPGTVLVMEHADVLETPNPVTSEPDVVVTIEQAMPVPDVICTVTNSNSHQEDSNLRMKPKRVPLDVMKAMTLSVAYSANIGGITTLTSTPPNGIMKEHADRMWQSHGIPESPVTFSTWLVIGLPVSCLCIVCVWVWLMAYFIGSRAFFSCGKNSINSQILTHTDIKKEVKKLGRVSWAEKMVAFLMVVMIVLWLLRNPSGVIGWDQFFRQGYVKDSAISIMVSSCLFVIPFDTPHFIKKKYKHKETKTKAYSKDTLLDCPLVEHSLPWGVVLVLGGGAALGEACLVSGLSLWVSKQLEVFDSFPPFFMICIVCLLAAFLTEVTSNTATCNICMPIVATMAENLGYNPLYVMFPTAIACSMAFMLPASTPPNAILFSYKRVSVWDMMKCGLMLKLLVLFPAIAAQTWGYEFFDFGTVPWANITMATPDTTIILTSITNLPTVTF